MKIALIGPGIMPIPTDGWGAVESIIWQYSLGLKALGHEVTIFNTLNLGEVANAINCGAFDFVHLHYDEYIDFFNKNLATQVKKKYAVTSHFGYILQPQYWQGYYDRIFKATLDAPAIIGLWDKIGNLYKNNGYKGKYTTLRNGAEVEKFRFTETPKYPDRLICVGKVESRKCQALLQNILADNIPIDFVGPLGDTTLQDSGYSRYLGSWTREQLYNNLTDYGSLILMSLGEAAPLVVPEAFAAGLNVIVSESASANIKNSFIIRQDYVLHKGVIITAYEVMHTKISQEQRLSQRRIAEEFYSWDVIIKEYVNIIQGIIDGN